MLFRPPVCRSSDCGLGAWPASWEHGVRAGLAERRGSGQRAGAQRCQCDPVEVVGGRGVWAGG